MNVTDLPEAITSKIHDYEFDCNKVRLNTPKLTAEGNKTCEEDEIPVLSTNYLENRQLRTNNKIKCCRKRNSYQSFFEAHGQGKHALKRDIIASFIDEEATNEKINELLTHNLQEGHFELVYALLKFRTMNDLQLSQESLVKSLEKPIIFYTIFPKKIFTSYEVRSLLYSVVNRLTIEFPLSPNQVWRKCNNIPQFKNVVTSQSLDFVHSKEQPIPPFYLIQKCMNVPNIPGLVVVYQNEYFEHCDVPYISMLLRVINTNWLTNLFVQQITEVLKRYIKKCTVSTFDTSICLDFCEKCFLNVEENQELWGEIYIDIFLLREDIAGFLKQKLEETNFTISYNNILNALQKKNFNLTNNIIYFQFNNFNIRMMIECLKLFLKTEQIDACKQFIHRLPYIHIQDKKSTMSSIVSDLFDNNTLTHDLNFKYYLETTYANNVQAVLVELFDKFSFYNSPRVRTLDVFIQSYLLPWYRRTIQEKLKAFGIHHVIIKVK